MLLHLCLPLVVVFIQPTLSTYNCSSEYNRVPDNTDMMVDCGTSMITLEVNLCSAQWAGFNATGLALNGEHSVPDCQGTVHTDVVPPVIRYQLPVNHTRANPCRQSLQIVDEAPDPSGHFGDYLTVQSVIITGFVDTPGSSEGLISYATDLYYHFSCRYPLEYLLNNTQITASSVSVANRDNNGTFIDTLKMTVYNTERHDFFTTGCSVDQKAALTINGVAKNSRFNFEAFRFVEHRDQEKSSIYLHCMLRLCEPTKCQALIDACLPTSRRRRSSARSVEQDTEEVATVSFGPLAMGREDSSLAAEDEDAASQSPAEDSSVTAVVLGALFGSAAVTLVILASWMAVKKFYYSGAGLSAFN